MLNNFEKKNYGVVKIIDIIDKENGDYDIFMSESEEEFGLVDFGIELDVMDMGVKNEDKFILKILLEKINGKENSLFEF